MKKILYIAVAMSLAVSCFKDDRLNDVVQDFVGFSEVNITNPEEFAASRLPSITICSGHYYVGISKSGRSLSEASVTVEMLSDISALNTELGTAYKVLPSNLTTISGTSFSFTKEECVKTLSITWKPEDVEAHLAANPGDYVIPLRMSGSQLIKKDRDLLVIRLLPSAIRLATFNVKGEELDTDQKEYDSKDKTGYDIPDIRIFLAQPNRRDDLTVELAIDNDRIDAFQTSTGYYYNAPPEGTVRLKDSKVTIAAGEVTAPVNLIVDNDKLGATHPGYVVPVVIKSTSLPLPATRDIIYLVIKPVL